MNNSTILIRDAAASVDDVCARIASVATSHKFGLLGEHNLQEKMASKGFPFGRACRVFEICNPQQAHTILSGNIAVSAALPCRISVYEQNGRTVLATIDPAALLQLFGSASTESKQVADEVRTGLVRIMDELCGGNSKMDPPAPAIVLPHRQNPSARS